MPNYSTRKGSIFGAQYRKTIWTGHCNSYMVVTPLDLFPALKLQCYKQILCNLEGPWNKANKEGCKEKR